MKPRMRFHQDGGSWTLLQSTPVERRKATCAMRDVPFGLAQKHSHLAVSDPAMI